jgi:NNP family nitrate/nitrite transporter-like MFS transporter
MNLIAALRSGHWPSLVGAWLHFEVSFMVWLLVGALSVAMAEEFALSASQKGLLVALPLLGGALLRIPVGLWNDRAGSKTVGLALLTAQAFVLVLGWVGVTTFVKLLVVALLIGSAGASFAIALPLASRSYPPASQGLAMGIAASANSGTVLALLLAPRLADAFGWRAVFGFMFMTVLACGAAFALLVQPDEPGGRRLAGNEQARAFAGLTREPRLYELSFLYAVTFGGFVGLSSYLPIVFRDQYGFSFVDAGTVTALCGLGGSLIRPVGGFVADRAGALAVLCGLFPTLAVLLVVASGMPGPGSMWMLSVGIVTAFGFGNGVVFRLVGDRFRDQIGAATGCIGAAGALGGFFLPILFGLLNEETHSFRGGFLVGACLCLVATAAVVWRARRHRMELQRVGSISH